jgi:hypothetical protein
VSKMNTYYTAKDIEKLASSGVRRIELDSTAVLTDFARETAQQLGVELVRKDSRNQLPAQPESPKTPEKTGSKYNKPSGCQHAAVTVSVTANRTTDSTQVPAGSNDPTVNKLIDLMGKVIKRGD